MSPPGSRLLTTHTTSKETPHNVAVKIRLKRMGKIRVPQYRIVVVDSRKKRDGRVIEEIGKYHPKEEPVVHRGQLRPGAVLARRRRAADRGRRGDPQGHRRLAEVQGPAGHRGHPEGRRAQARQARDLQRGAQGGRAASPRATPSTKKAAAKKAATKADDKADEPKAERAPRPRRPRPRLPPTETPAEARPTRPRPPRRPTAEADAGKSRGLSAMLAEALEHLVRGIVEHPDDVTVARQAAAPRLDPRGARAPRRPRQGDRPRRPHRHRASAP